MRVLFDALGSTEQCGGMRLHAIEMISTWAERYLHDQIYVVGAHHLDREMSGLENVSIVHWPSASVLFRAPGQFIITPIVGKLSSVDAVVSLSPIVSPFCRGVSVCFMHDWRHLRRPEQVGVGQRCYRRLWKVFARFSTLTVCISPKSESETLSVVPIANTVCIPNGRDHARRWQMRSPLARLYGSTIVTLGHHNNKLSELVMKAMSSMIGTLPKNWCLYVLGATGNYRRRLVQLAAEIGVSQNVRFPGFVDDKAYENILSSASCIVLASSDEGFGLPLADAKYLGIPSVVTRDSGVTDLFPSSIQADPTVESLARAVGSALNIVPNEASSRPIWTWGDVVSRLRRCVV